LNVFGVGQEVSEMADAARDEAVPPDDPESCSLEHCSAWDGTTGYRVTDLCLFSSGDLTELAAALVARGLDHRNGPRWFDEPEWSRLDGPHWYWRFQAGGEESHDEPEPELAALLAAVEGLGPAARAAWDGCARRAFDAAYDCGVRPFAVRHELSAGTLARLAAAGGVLRVTLYALDPSEVKHAERIKL
jgi:hypothetical protein